MCVDVRVWVWAGEGSSGAGRRGGLRGPGAGGGVRRGRGVEPDQGQTIERPGPPRHLLSRKTRYPHCFQQTLVNHTTFCCAYALL